MHRYNGALLSEKIEIENFTEAHLKITVHIVMKKEKINKSRKYLAASNDFGFIIVHSKVRIF